MTADVERKLEESRDAPGRDAAAAAALADARAATDAAAAAAVAPRPPETRDARDGDFLEALAASGAEALEVLRRHADGPEPLRRPDAPEAPDDPGPPPGSLFGARGDVDPGDLPEPWRRRFARAEALAPLLEPYKKRLAPPDEAPNLYNEDGSYDFQRSADDSRRRGEAALAAPLKPRPLPSLALEAAFAWLEDTTAARRACRRFADAVELAECGARDAATRAAAEAAAREARAAASTEVYLREGREARREAGAAFAPPGENPFGAAPPEAALAHYEAALLAAAAHWGDRRMEAMERFRDLRDGRYDGDLEDLRRAALDLAASTDADREERALAATARLAPGDLARRRAARLGAAGAAARADAAEAERRALEAARAARESGAGRHERATCPTSKAPISAVFHSFRLIFGRASISRNGLEAWMLSSSTRARGTLTLKRRRISVVPPRSGIDAARREADDAERANEALRGAIDAAAAARRAELDRLDALGAEDLPPVSAEAAADRAEFVASLPSSQPVDVEARQREAHAAEALEDAAKRLEVVYAKHAADRVRIKSSTRLHCARMRMFRRKLFRRASRTR